MGICVGVAAWLTGLGHPSHSFSHRRDNGSHLPGVPMCALLSRAGCIVWEQIEDSRALPPRGSEVVVTPVSRQ